MSLIGELLEHLRSAEPSVSGVVARSYPREQNDKRIFYVYSGGRPRYIVISPNDEMGKARLLSEDRILNAILARLSRTQSRDGILRPSRYIETASGFFAVTEYVKPARRFSPTRSKCTDFREILDQSCNWILDFQKETLYPSDQGAEVVPAGFKERLMAWAETNRAVLSPPFFRLQELCLKAARSLKHALPAAACHGDFCFVNYFIDTCGMFRVCDWECAHQKQSVARDYLGNLVVYALALRSFPTQLPALAAIFRPRTDDSEYVKSLTGKLRLFREVYKVDADALPVCFTVAYLTLLLRCTSRRNIQAKLRFADEFATLLS